MRLWINHVFLAILALMFVPLGTGMWDSENERLGFRACTPAGYMLRGFGELTCFCGFIAWFVIPGYLILQLIRNDFPGSGFWLAVWLMIVPLALRIIGYTVLFLSWKLATWKEFRYDYETQIARWLDRDHESFRALWNIDCDCWSSSFSLSRQAELAGAA